MADAAVWQRWWLCAPSAGLVPEIAPDGPYVTEWDAFTARELAVEEAARRSPEAVATHGPVPTAPVRRALAVEEDRAAVTVLAPGPGSACSLEARVVDGHAGPRHDLGLDRSRCSRPATVTLVVRDAADRPTWHLCGEHFPVLLPPARPGAASSP
jgi:hypothetical protein